MLVCLLCVWCPLLAWSPYRCAPRKPQVPNAEHRMGEVALNGGGRQHSREAGMVVTRPEMWVGDRERQGKWAQLGQAGVGVCAPSPRRLVPATEGL